MEAYRKQLTSISEYLLCVWNPARYIICKYLKLSMPKMNSPIPHFPAKYNLNLLIYSCSHQPEEAGWAPLP